METISTFENSDNNHMPNNNMTMSIIGAVLGLCSPCCIGLITGIIAIVLASQVNNKYMAEDFEGARNSASNAKILAIISIVLGIIGLILNAINFMFLGNNFYQDLINNL